MESFLGVHKYFCLSKGEAKHPTKRFLRLKHQIIFDFNICYFLADYKEELLKWVPAEILPEAYGGTLKDPDGDPRCPSKVRNVTKMIK